jgi:hypothetical protein
MPIYPIAANVQVSATALPLPDGASTEATLAAVSGKLPALISGKIPVSAVISGSVSPAQGTTITNSNFTSVTPSTSLVSAEAGRRVLTVYNEGAGVIHISGGATCTTASYQIRLGVGEYWECPEGQLSLAHSAVFATAGTAKVSQVT